MHRERRVADAGGGHSAGHYGPVQDRAGDMQWRGLAPIDCDLSRRAVLATPARQTGQLAH